MPEMDALEDEDAFSCPPPPDEREWWNKQLGKPIESPEPEPALH